MNVDKLAEVLEKHKVRIAAGIQLAMCYFSFRSVFKKELRKRKKKKHK